MAQEDRRRLTVEHRFKSAAEMAELFADVPEAIANTLVIARRCAFMAPAREPILPTFAQDEEAEMRRQAAEGLERRLAQVVWQPGMDAAAREAAAAPYRERLAYELDVIAQMKFPGYFLIVSDFIKWAKANGVPVGPGRGSGAGSVVAWSLEITDLDPLRFGLLFERFLNPERVSMPDFDIDFCEDRRARGHHLCPRPLRCGPGGADHHLRHAAGARRAARRRPGAGPAVRAGRPDLQAGAAQSGQPGDAGAGDRDGAAAEGGARRRSRAWRG